MASIVVNDVTHVFAPNPALSEEHWDAEYPPIKANTKWLVNKYTGEILPNTYEFARRSDILEPYYGELPDSGFSTSTINDINEVLNNTDTESTDLTAL